MQNRVISSGYIPVSGRIFEKLDPRVHLFFWILFIAAVLMHNPFKVEILSGLLLILTVYYYFSDMRLQKFLRRIITIYPMIFFVSVLLPFTDIAHSAETVVTVWNIKIYSSGLENFVTINIKMVLIYSVTLLVSRSAGIFRFLKSLEILKLPGWIIAILTYMHQLFFLLKAEMSRIQTAFSSRYNYLPFFKRVKIISGIMIVYLTRIIERSDRTYLAMISKGFNGKMPNGKNIRWTWRDSVFSAMAAAYFGLLFYVF